jgi:hypothetical protein
VNLFNKYINRIWPFTLDENFFLLLFNYMILFISKQSFLNVFFSNQWTLIYFEGIEYIVFNWIIVYVVTYY